MALPADDACEPKRCASHYEFRAGGWAYWRDASKIGQYVWGNENTDWEYSIVRLFKTCIIGQVYRAETESTEGISETMPYNMLPAKYTEINGSTWLYRNVPFGMQSGAVFRTWRTGHH